MYLFKDTSTLNRLISAHKRGVKVQVLIDDGATNARVRRLRKALGTREDLRRSFVTKCKRGCFIEQALDDPRQGVRLLPGRQRART